MPVAVEQAVVDAPGVDPDRRERPDLERRVRGLDGVSATRRSQSQRRRAVAVAARAVPRTGGRPRWLGGPRAEVDDGRPGSTTRRSRRRRRAGPRAEAGRHSPDAPWPDPRSAATVPRGSRGAGTSPAGRGRRRCGAGPRRRAGARRCGTRGLQDLGGARPGRWRPGRRRGRRGRRAAPGASADLDLVGGLDEVLERVLQVVALVDHVGERRASCRRRASSSSQHDEEELVRGGSSRRSGRRRRTSSR